MRMNIRLAPGVFAVVTDGPRNHLITIRRKGYLSELHYPVALFWRAVECGDIHVIKEPQHGDTHHHAAAR